MEKNLQEGQRSSQVIIYRKWFLLLVLSREVLSLWYQSYFLQISKFLSIRPKENQQGIHTAKNHGRIVLSF